MIPVVGKVNKTVFRTLKEVKREQVTDMVTLPVDQARIMHHKSFNEDSF